MFWDGSGNESVPDPTYPCWDQLSRALSVPGVLWNAEHFSLLWTGRCSIKWGDLRTVLQKDLATLFSPLFSPSCAEAASHLSLNGDSASSLVHHQRILSSSSCQEDLASYLIVGNVPISVGDRAAEFLRDIQEGLKVYLPHVASLVSLANTCDSMTTGVIGIGAGTGSLVVALTEAVDAGFGRVNFAAQEVHDALGRRGKRCVYTFLLVGERERRTVLVGAPVGVVRGAAGKGMAGELVRRACHRSLSQRLDCNVALLPTLVRSVGLEELVFVVTACGPVFTAITDASVKALQTRMGVSPGGIPETIAFNGVYVELYGQLSDVAGRPLGMLEGKTSVGTLSNQAFLLRNVSSTVSLDELLTALEFANKDGLTLAMVDWLLLLLNQTEWVVMLHSEAVPVREQYQIPVGRELRMGGAGAVATRIGFQPRWRLKQFPPAGTKAPQLKTNPNSFSFSNPIGSSPHPEQSHGRNKSPKGRATAGKGGGWSQVAPPGRRPEMSTATYSQALKGTRGDVVALAARGDMDPALQTAMEAIAKLAIQQRKSEELQTKTLLVLDKLMAGEERQAEAIRRMDRFIQENLPHSSDV